MTPEKLLKQAQVYFEDVVVGTEIPPLRKGPYTVMDIAKFASMYGDFYPGHYDNKWAVEMDHIPGAIAHGYQVITYLGQMLTDWVSPNGWLRKLSSQVRAQTYVGDSLTFKGKVTAKRRQDGANVLECAVSGENQDGLVVVQGMATVYLPSRN